MLNPTALNVLCLSVDFLQLFVLVPILLFLCYKYNYSHFQETTSTERALSLIITCTTAFSLVIANPYLSVAHILQFDHSINSNPHENNNLRWLPLLLSECPFWFVVILCTLKSWTYYFDHKLAYAQSNALWAIKIDPFYKKHNFWINNKETFGNLLWVGKKLVLPSIILLLLPLILCGSLLGIVFDVPPWNVPLLERVTPF